MELVIKHNDQMIKSTPIILNLHNLNITELPVLPDQIP